MVKTFDHGQAPVCCQRTASREPDAVTKAVLVLCLVRERLFTPADRVDVRSRVEGRVQVQVLAHPPCLDVHDGDATVRGP